MCNGSGTEWVDWAGDYAPCSMCKGIGTISREFYHKWQRQNLKYEGTRLQKKLPLYRIYSVWPRWDNRDAITGYSYHEVRTFHNRDYALKVLEKMLGEDDLDFDYGPPYVLMDSDFNKVWNNSLVVCEDRNTYDYPF
jgi:hypothetical protein